MHPAFLFRKVLSPLTFITASLSSHASSYPTGVNHGTRVGACQGRCEDVRAPGEIIPCDVESLETFAGLQTVERGQLVFGEGENFQLSEDAERADVGQLIVVQF